MSRSQLWLIALLAAVFMTVGGTAQAERLGGAYRGPSDTGAQEKDSGSDTDSSDSGGDDIDSGPSSGDSGEGDSGFGSDSGGGGGGDEGGGGEEGGGAPEGDSGGDDGGGFSSGGDSSGGASAGGSDTSGGGGLGGGGGGAAGGRGKSGSATQEAFQRVQFYFEHNREQYVYRVAEARNKSISMPRYSSVARFGVLARDTRERSSITPQDRERIFDVLKKQVRSDQSVVRDAAVLALGKMGTPEAFQVLVDSLAAEDKIDVKQDTLLALGMTRSPAAVDVIKPFLQKRDYQSYALLGLGLTRNAEVAGPIVLEFLQENASKDKLADALCSASMALGALRYEPAVGELEDLMKREKALDVTRVYAVHALGKIGGQSAQKALLKGMKDGNIEVARAAVLGLGECGDAAALSELAGKRGIHKNKDVLAAGFACVSLASVLQRVPESEWKKYPDELREFATSPQKSNVRAQYANLALALCNGIDNDIREYYNEQLVEHKLQRDTMASLAMAAGLSGHAAYEPAMIEMASSAAVYGQTRGYAALAVGMLGAPGEAPDKLRAIYKDAEDPDVRRGAILGLGLVGDRSDVPFLLGVIKDAEEGLHTYTRGAAVVALGLIRDGDSINQIQALLGSTDARTRAFAVAALGYLADRDPAPTMPRLFAANNFRQEFDTLKSVMSNL